MAAFNLLLLLFLSVSSNGESDNKNSLSLNLHQDQPVREIEPDKKCPQYVTNTSPSSDRELDVALPTLLEAEDKPRFIAKGPHSKIYKIKYKQAPAAVKIMTKMRGANLIKTELYYWLKMFEKHPEDTLEFKFCISDSQNFYLISELMEGNLGLLKAPFRKDFSKKQQLKLLLKMETILLHMHELHIVHHSINPGNFLVRYKNPEDYKLKIAEFGIAEEEAEVNSNVGSANFMPPECFQGTDSFKDKSGDTWAMGITFMELFTDDFKLADECYVEMYTVDCHKSLMDQITEFFEKNLGFKDRKAPAFAETENIMEVIKAMLSYSPDERPNPADVVKKLEQLIEKALVI